MREMWVQSLDWEDPLEKEKATPLQDSCLGNPMDEGAWGGYSRCVAKQWDMTE